MTTQAREVRVAPNIYQRFGVDGQHTGWRVFVRKPDPKTGRSKLAPVPFPARTTIEELQHFRDSYKLEAKHERRRRTRAAIAGEAGFTADARRYLALEKVKAMPSFASRKYEVETWIAIFEDRPRRSITASDIDEQLQALRNEGYSGSSVNKFRTALMNLWTRLDGRSAANPVKDTELQDEAAVIARAQPYELLIRILDHIPRERGRGVKGEEGSRSRGSESRARLEVLAWTGIEPGQLGRMTAEHVSLKEGWYISPPRQKGARRRRSPRPLIRKPMSPQAKRAFARLMAMGLLGKRFSTHSLRHTWERAVRRTEKQLREEYNDPAFTLPHIRLKDIRHSFGTKLFEQVARTQKSERAALEIVGLMLDHAPGSPMPLRYSLGAVSSALRSHTPRFGRPTRARKNARSRKVLQAGVTRRGKG